MVVEIGKGNDTDTRNYLYSSVCGVCVLAGHQMAYGDTGFWGLFASGLDIHIHNTVPERALVMAALRSDFDKRCLRQIARQKRA